MNLYTYVRNDPLNNVDPYGKETYFLKLTGDAYIPTGIGGGIGVFFNPGTKPGEKFDFGLTGNVDIANGNPQDMNDLGLGADLSVGIEVGFLEGSAENLSGRARNINAGAGSGLGGSYTNTTTQDANGNEVKGHAVALEGGVTPVSGSTTVSQGFKVGVQDAISAVKNAIKEVFKKEEPDT